MGTIYMEDCDIDKCLEQADKLWFKQCSFLEKYCSMSTLDGDPSWCLGPIVHISDSPNTDKEFKKYVKRLLAIVKEESDGLSKFSVKFLQENMKSEWFIKSREKSFPGMSDDDIIYNFLKEKKSLESKYQKLIESIKGCLKE